MRKINLKEIDAFEESAITYLAGGSLPDPDKFIQRHGLVNTFYEYDLIKMCSIFFYTWRDLNCIKSDETLSHMVKYILNATHIQRNILSMKQHFSLKGKKVLDTGSCWGSLSYFLQREGAELTCVDACYAHTVFSKMLVPQAEVYHGDVRAMDLLLDESFDIVISRGVIEHVGDFSIGRGPTNRVNYLHKSKYMREMSRVLKKDGTIWLSTGNYSFPFDGEINQWFFHWLPVEYQNMYLEQANEGADMYWLLTWEQMLSLLKESGMCLSYIEKTQSENRWRENIYKVFSSFDRQAKLMTSLLCRLIETDPRFMQHWELCLKKDT